MKRGRIGKRQGDVPKQLVDSGSFATIETSVMVQKDLLAFSGSVGGGVPTMSFVTQTFHETGTAVPEPASLVSTAIATALLSSFWLLKKRRAFTRNSIRRG